MKIIAIESSAATASVAYADRGRIIGEYTTDHKKTHSQTLLPMLDELMRMTEVKPECIDAIAVSAGPGSYTGLRIGAALAKGLAEGWGKKIIPVSALEGLAYRLRESDTLICPIMDARRGQVYSGIYRFAKDSGALSHGSVSESSRCMETIEEGAALLLTEQIERLNARKEAVVFLGDGVDAHAERIAELCRVPYRFASPEFRYQSAAAIAGRAEALGEAGMVDAAVFAPEYLRQSQAERELNERAGKSGE